MEPLGAENAWIASVRGAQRRLYALPTLIIASIAISFALLAAPLLYEGFENPRDGGGLTSSFSRAISYLFVFTPLYMCAGLSRILERRALIRAAFGGWRGFGLGAAVAGVLFLLAVLAASIAGFLQEPPTSTRDGLLLGVGLATSLTAYQAYAEELFFRGWLQPILATEWGLFLGLAISSGLFTVAHCVTQEVGAIAVVNIALAGLLFGLMALRTGSVATSFAAHATWNWLEQSAFGLLPNPGVDALGSLTDLDLIGPGVLSGGRDGLNGSLFVTAVLAMALVAFLLPAFVKETAGTLQRRS